MATVGSKTRTRLLKLKRAIYVTIVALIMLVSLSGATMIARAASGEGPTSGENALKYCRACHANFYAKQVQVLYNGWDAYDDPFQIYFNCSRCHTRVEEIPYMPFKSSCDMCHINGNPSLGLTSGVENITASVGVKGIGVIHKTAEENTGVKVHGETPGKVSKETCGQCHTRHVITNVANVYTSSSGCVDHKMCMCDYCGYSTSVGIERDPAYKDSIVPPLVSIEEIKETIAKTSQKYESVYEKAVTEGLPEPLEKMKKDCGRCHWMVYENGMAAIKARADIGKGIPHDPTIILNCSYCHVQKKPESPFVPTVLYADELLQSIEWANEVVKQPMTCSVCHFVSEDGRIGPVITTLGFQHVAYSEYTATPIHVKGAEPISVESCGRCHNDHYDTMKKWETSCKTSCHDTSVERPYITAPMDKFVLNHTNGHMCGHGHCFCLCDLGFEWHHSHLKSGLAKIIKKDLSKTFSYDQRYVGNVTQLRLIHVWKLRWEGAVPPTAPVTPSPPVTTTVTTTVITTKVTTTTVPTTVVTTTTVPTTVTKPTTVTVPTTYTTTHVKTTTTTTTAPAPMGTVYGYLAGGLVIGVIIGVVAIYVLRRS